MKNFSLQKLFIIVTAIFIGSFVNAKNPMKTLVVTGQNNHNWQVSHQAIKRILENSGLFFVDFAISPEKGQDMSEFIIDFKPYDVVVLDYNGDMWPEETRNNFVEYTKNGGGVVIYHAANNAFPDWREYNEICALGGWEGRNEKSGPYVYWENDKMVKDNSPGIGGSHGSQHIYILKGRTSNHPVINGLPNRWLHVYDELYDRMRGPGNLKDVFYTAFSDTETGGSGREEPLIFSVDYHKGRIFHIMLGHAGKSLKENAAMQCTGFQVLFLRGTEWAATGKVTQKVPDDFPSSFEFSLRNDYRAPIIMK